MSRADLTREVLALSPAAGVPGNRNLALALVALGAVGLGIGFAGVDPKVGWTALLTGTVITIGLAMVGVLLSAIFQLTGARWGRSYRRLAEASVALMPLGLIGVAAIMAGGNAYLPWVAEHPHVGGKAVWLTRGFWDARVAGALLIAYAVALRFVYYSLRRDFCIGGVRERFTGWIGRRVSGGITDPEAEARRCEARLSVLAPIVAVTYAVMFSLLGFDLIMALEPDWFSTLFGAWYFIGHIFTGLALLVIVSWALRARLKLERFIPARHQSDLATLLLAFCLVNADFFWNQYLTIWYANLPEETFYVMERTADGTLPWRSLSFVSLFAFFAIPFFALLFRRVKNSRGLITAVAASVVVGIFLGRFIEIAPTLLKIQPGGGLGVVALPLAAAALVLAGFLGGGLLLYEKFLAQVPLFPLGDEIFAHQFEAPEESP